MNRPRFHRFSILPAVLALALSAAGAQAAQRKPAKPATPPAAPANEVLSNEALTANYYQTLISGPAPKSAELTLFFTQMPKGGDLHHHYSGALYAEQYLQFVDRMGYCVNMHTYRIETDVAVIAEQRGRAPGDRTCRSGADTIADDHTYRELLQRWSSKDFHNHGALQPPPDRQFFQTFGFFNPVAGSFLNDGLRTLRQRAIEENVSYIETVFELAPFVQDSGFDSAMLEQGASDASLIDRMRTWLATLEKDAKFNAGIEQYVARAKSAHTGIDDERFMLRYQAYVLRFLSPSQVFSSMVSAFRAAGQSELIVGVNIVGQESQHVSMRDYALHMKMFRFLKTRYPQVKLSLHAGELALGDVPPEGLKTHIDQALNVAGANRIGHGLDIAHEINAPVLLRALRDKDVPVEINLTSNAFISGVEGENHPITLYRKYGVPYVISTDDAGVTRHNLAGEYTLFASRYKPDYAEVKKAVYNSIRYAFLPPNQRNRLTQQLDARFAFFEARMAALQGSSSMVLLPEDEPVSAAPDANAGGARTGKPAKRAVPPKPKR
jgi:adenosine deaminase/adenosine deaminase CECR1